MLVLSRKYGECLVIGKDIQVTVLGIHGNRVKLGVVGPAQVPIRRAEIEQPRRRTKLGLDTAACL